MAVKKDSIIDYEKYGITVDNWAYIIRHGFLFALEKGIKPDPKMGWGQPGVGKTLGVYQAAREIEKVLGFPTLTRCLLTSCMDPCDVTGVPFEAGENKEYCQYKPMDWAYNASTLISNGPPMIIFFDDVAVAHQQTQAAFFKVVHEHMVGHLTLRNNVMIVGAANRVEDNAAAQEMPTALANRFEHCYIKSDTDSWLKWALSDYGRIHPMAVAFIRRHPNHLNKFTPESSEKAQATPRSWEMASRKLHEWGLERVNRDYLSKALTGTIGQGLALEFEAFLSRTKSAVSPETIVKDPQKAPVPKPEDLDALHATVAGLQTYLSEHPQHWHPCLVYSNREEMVDELGVTLAMHTSKLIDDKLTDAVRKKAVMDDEFLKMVERYGDYLITSA